MWILLHVVFARHACRRTAAGKGRITVVSTEGGIKHQSHVLEVFGTAVLGMKRKERCWHCPRVRIWFFAQKISWLLSLAEEPCPNLPAVRVPFSCPCTTSSLIQSCTPGTLWLLLAAALIFVFVWGMDPAILGRTALLITSPSRAREVHVFVHIILVTIGPRMQRGCGIGLVVHSFQDVILAPPRPSMLRVLTIHPESRPRSARNRCMVEFDDKEAIFEPLIRLESYSFAALGTAEHLSCVHTHVDAVKSCRDQTFATCLFKRNKFHRSVRGIGAIIKRPVREEIITYERVPDHVTISGSSRPWCKNSTN
mmetsp:Transcript_25606/g.56030  ORF Transcript_25606/g.56030 Transcript_25606/m.56030 type:complete len:310 (-) Transcript_25606:238-1167(-)